MDIEDLRPYAPLIDPIGYQSLMQSVGSLWMAIFHLEESLQNAYAFALVGTGEVSRSAALDERGKLKEHTFGTLVTLLSRQKLLPVKRLQTLRVLNKHRNWAAHRAFDDIRRAIHSAAQRDQLIAKLDELSDLFSLAHREIMNDVVALAHKYEVDEKAAFTEARIRLQSLEGP